MNITNHAVNGYHPTSNQKADKKEFSKQEGEHTFQALSHYPKTSFKIQQINKDGDCLFNGFLSGASGSLHQSNLADIQALRNTAADYIHKHLAELSNQPAFHQAGTMNLYELLKTPGQWNADAGDLVPYVIAQVTGKNIHILQENGDHYKTLGIAPANNPELPASNNNGSTSSTSAPVFLLKNNNHYDALRKSETFTEDHSAILNTTLNQSLNSEQPDDVIAKIAAEPSGKHNSLAKALLSERESDAAEKTQKSEVDSLSNIHLSRSTSATSINDDNAAQQKKGAILGDYIDQIQAVFNQLAMPDNTRKSQAEPWQSKEINRVIQKMQPKIAALKEQLKNNLDDTQLAGIGIQANLSFAKGFKDIAQIAEKKIKTHRKDQATVNALTILRNTADLASQNHQSSAQLGTVAKARMEFNESVPRHIKERIATTGSLGVENKTTHSNKLGLSLALPFVTSLSAQAKYDKSQSAQVYRADDGNHFHKNVQQSKKGFSLTGKLGLASQPFFPEASKIFDSISANASLAASHTKEKGTVSLGKDSNSTFAAQHAAKLSKGLKAGDNNGRLANITGIEDTFGNAKISNVSEVGIKQGYHNEADIAKGLTALFGRETKTIYDSKLPLGKMFAADSMDSNANTIDQPAMGAMSEAFSKNPNWRSKEYERNTWQANVNVNAKAGFMKYFKMKAGADIAVDFAKTQRIVRSPALPHQMFNPSSTMSPNRSLTYAKNYYQTPTKADIAISKTLAQATGFTNGQDFFSAMAHSFDSKKTTLKDVNAEALGRHVRQFQADINTIDQFFIQNKAQLRSQKLPDVQAAIQRVNESYNATLPMISEKDLHTLQATNKSGYSPAYQAFQDTAAAILNSYSAAAGAMKLLADFHTQSPEQAKNLTQAAEQILTPINQKTMPWNDDEIASRAPYVRQVVAQPFSDSISVTGSHEALLTHNLKGGTYDLASITDNEENLLKGDDAPGLGRKATTTFSKTVYPDHVMDPGLTGISRSTTTTVQKNQAPYGDLRKQTTIKGKLKEAAREVMFKKQEVDYEQRFKRTAGYTTHRDENMETARQFTAVRNAMTIKERGISAKISASAPISTPAGVTLTPSISLGKGTQKNNYELNNFTYGNDVGVISIIASKLLSDNNLDLKQVSDDINDTLNQEKNFTLIDDMDSRVAHALLGDKDYDHMSAILSKFRNSGIQEVTEDGKTTIRLPQITDNSMAKSDLNNQLHTSKGEPLDLSGEQGTAKKFADRSGLFGFMIGHFDNELIHDAYQYWKQTEDVSFPDLKRIDTLLSAKVSNSDKTRQQWLKTASEEERKDFYQNDPAGREMLLNYLKVASVAGVMNDTIFMNNSYTVMRDEQQVAQVDKLFKTTGA